jgi:ariadne-1
MCFSCKVPWHDGLSCEEYVQNEAANPETASTMEWIRAHTKPCPNSRAAIEKNAGCSHMKCKYLQTCFILQDESSR